MRNGDDFDRILIYRGYFTFEKRRDVSIGFQYKINRSGTKYQRGPYHSALRSGRHDFQGYFFAYGRRGYFNSRGTRGILGDFSVDCPRYFGAIDVNAITAGGNCNFLIWDWIVGLGGELQTTTGYGYLGEGC